MNEDLKIEVSEAGLIEKSVIRNMMELYQYDFSEFEGTDLDDHGLFDYRYLDHYWVEDGRFPFIIRVNGKLAGFEFVNRHTYSEEGEYAIAEFLVMRKYRRRGVGKRAAHLVFDKCPGWWEVQQTYRNAVAQSFWRSVIREYTEGDFREYSSGVGGWDGPVQTFKSRNAT